MSKSIKNSIDEFVSELQARIDLLNSSLVSSNVRSNEESIDAIKNIIEIYTETPIQKLTISDVYSISLIDIKKILKLIGRSNEYIDETMLVLKKNEKNLNIYEAIRKMIVDYASEFYSMQKSQGEVITSNIQEYQKIIDLLVSDNTFELANDINHLMNIMNSVNLANDSKANILVHIANKNSSNYAEKIEYDMNRLMGDIIAKCYPEENSIEYKFISSYPFRGDEAPDEISAIASNLHRKAKCSYSTFYNCMIAYLVKRQAHNLFSTSNISEKIRIKDYITSLVQNIIGIEEEIIQESEQIIEEYAEIFESLAEEGYTDYQEYEELSIDELKGKYHSFETAIQLKKSVIIKYIMENVKIVKSFNLREINEDEEFEYYLTLDKLFELKTILEDCVEQEKLESKRINE